MDASTHSHFWSKIAEKYDSVVDFQIGPQTRAMARDRLRREGDLGNVVEFGCGTGFYTSLLAERADWLAATDLAPGMLDLAKRNAKATNVAFKEENCQQTSFPDSTFDTAFLGLVLHFTDARKTLTETRRILKPGGTVIILNPDPGSLRGWDRFRWVVRAYYYGITRYRFKPPKGLLKDLPTSRRVCDLLQELGFDISATEAVRNTARSYNIPIDYIKAVKNPAKIPPATDAANLELANSA